MRTGKLQGLKESMQPKEVSVHSAESASFFSRSHRVSGGHVRIVFEKYIEWSLLLY